MEYSGNVEGFRLKQALYLVAQHTANNHNISNATAESTE